MFNLLTIPDQQKQNIAECMNRKPVDWIMYIAKYCNTVLILQTYL